MKQQSFEKAMERLEEIVTLLENGKAGLDESLAIFEEGVALVTYCNEKLTEAEQRVRVLVENKDGTVTEAPFQVSEAE